MYGLNLNTYNHIYDVPEGRSIIKDNVFDMQNSAWAILILLRMNNVKLHDNVLAGNGFAGMYINSGDNWEIKDNNMCDLMVSNPDGLTVEIDNSTDHIISDNTNQVIGGTSANDPTIYIGEAEECDDDDDDDDEDDENEDEDDDD